MTTQSDIKKLAEQMAGSMNSFDDIKDFQKQLMQSFIDTALEAEMEDHLGYPKHEKADKPNKRNGHTKKTVRSDTGDLEISTPRDRDGDFEPERGNSIESLNSVIRTAVNKRKVFPSDQAAFKVVYLATQQASKKWSMPIRNWTSALNRFMIMFDDLSVSI